MWATSLSLCYKQCRQLSFFLCCMANVNSSASSFAVCTAHTPWFLLCMQCKQVLPLSPQAARILPFSASSESSPDPAPPCVQNRQPRPLPVHCPNPRSGGKKQILRRDGELIDPGCHCIKNNEKSGSHQLDTPFLYNSFPRFLSLDQNKAQRSQLERFHSLWQNKTRARTKRSPGLFSLFISRERKQVEGVPLLLTWDPEEWRTPVK